MNTRIWLLPLLALIISISSGCAASGTRRAHQTEQDFSIDLTVLIGESARHAQNDGQRPHPLRQSRYVLFADGSLHYGAEPSRTAAWLPPRVRVLNQPQLAATWSLVESLALAEPSTAQDPVNFKTIRAEPGEVRYLAGFRKDNIRWAVIRNSPLEDPDAAMVRLIEYLAGLAYADESMQAQRIMPQRYDFGPDPYAQYR